MIQTIPHGEPGSINGYRCDACRAVTWTKHVDAGTTPFLMKCQKDDCDGLARSLMYPRTIPDGVEPTHEWFRPATEDAATAAAQADCAEAIEQRRIEARDGPVVVDQIMEHWRHGGAFLRKVDAPAVEPTVTAERFGALTTAAAKAAADEDAIGHALDRLQEVGLLAFGEPGAVIPNGLSFRRWTTDGGENVAVYLLTGDGERLRLLVRPDGSHQFDLQVENGKEEAFIRKALGAVPSERRILFLARLIDEENLQP